jgi:streptomycin 6-kinase
MAVQPIEIPEVLARHVIHGLGDAGKAWLQALPTVATALAERWGVTLGPPFLLSFNYVCRATRRDGTEAVLKIGPWPDGEIEREIEAVRLYDGDGMARLLEADVTQRAMLLERLRPGEMLLETAAQDDDAATRIGADLMRRLWRSAEKIPDPDRFKPLAEWFERAFERHRAFYGGPGPFNAAVLERGEAVAQDLLATSPRTVLLHGDFHHYNVLSSERSSSERAASERGSWLAIDPKGMLGDPGYDMGPFLLNPHGPPKSAAQLWRRLDILADELGYDWERLRDWGVAHAVLSACWSAEDHGDGWQDAMTMAETLIELRR